MNVKLRHHIADRRDIDLIAVRLFLVRERHDSDFRRQRKGIAAEIGEFDGVRTARDQDEPRPPH